MRSGPEPNRLWAPKRPLAVDLLIWRRSSVGPSRRWRIHSVPGVPGGFPGARRLFRIEWDVDLDGDVYAVVGATIEGGHRIILLSIATTASRGCT